MQGLYVDQGAVFVEDQFMTFAINGDDSCHVSKVKAPREKVNAADDIGWNGRCHLTCSPKTDPEVMRVYRPVRVKEILDEFHDTQEASYG